MNQDKHLFQFTGAQVSAAAHKRELYHRSRLDYWTAEQESIVAQARGLISTVKVREQAVTGGKRYEIIADITGAQDLNWKLQTAGGKIDNHRNLMKEYQLKSNAYATQSARVYELDPQDVAYFHLDGRPDEE